MKRTDLDNIELTLLLDAMYQRYGYDFRHYARTSVERRARHVVLKNGFKHISECIPLVLNDESFFESLVKEFSITVTELFRDPIVYRRLIESVFPKLKTYPFIRVWHAGCATGEEVYSLAILLKENGLYEKSRIYGTDFNDSALETSKQGIYRLENVKQFISNYQKAGGAHSFSDYYNAKYDSIAIDKSVKKNITFANHNLVSDGVFGEMNLIFCRNVLIYFDKKLQNHVLNLICDSLVIGGFLCLGTMESLSFSSVENKFELIADKEKIYQKKYSLDKDKKAAHEITRDFDAIVIGVSAGGLKVLNQLFSNLRKDLPLPVIVTQHLSPRDDSGLPDILNNKSQLKVIEAKDKMKLKPNHIYVGPPDFHLLFGENESFILSEEEKVNYSRPSIDVMFISASETFGNRLIGILLSGDSNDGAEGLRIIKSNGGLTIAQHPGSAEYAFMPQSAIDLDAADKILNINEIADFMNSL